jgi:hypothetical protein
MVEEHIVSGIAKTFPDHGILSEEGTDMKGSSSMTWIVDPLDGTANLIREIPWYSVSIARADGPEVVLGGCANPITGDLFWASRGKGAFRNGSAIHVSGTGSLMMRWLLWGFPSVHAAGSPCVEAGSRAGKGQGVRRFGSAALDFCCVASGHWTCCGRRALTVGTCRRRIDGKRGRRTVTRIDGSRSTCTRKMWLQATPSCTRDGAMPEPGTMIWNARLHQPHPFQGIRADLAW